MKYLFLGIALGLVIGVLPFWMHPAGIIIHPNGTETLSRRDELSLPRRRPCPSEFLPAITYHEGMYRLNAAGVSKNSYVSRERHNAAAGGGEFLAEYEKVGRFVEFFSIKGERFWKIKSMEYPKDFV